MLSQGSGLLPDDNAERGSKVLEAFLYFIRGIKSTGAWHPKYTSQVERMRGMEVVAVSAE